MYVMARCARGVGSWELGFGEAHSCQTSEPPNLRTSEPPNLRTSEPPQLPTPNSQLLLNRDVRRNEVVAAGGAAPALDAGAETVDADVVGQVDAHRVVVQQARDLCVKTG